MTITKEALYKKTPQEITALLYEACYNNLEKAISAINDKDFFQANIYLQKASDIVERLGAGLNYDAGIIADQLDALYNYMADKIIEANLKKDVKTIKEVMKILGEIMSAWNLAMKKNMDAQPKVLKQKANAYERNSIYQ